MCVKTEDLNFTPMRYQNYKTVLLRRRCKEYVIHETEHVLYEHKNILKGLDNIILFAFREYNESQKFPI